MKITIMLLTGILLSFASIKASKKFERNALYFFAIGSIINASIFHFVNFEMLELGLVFSTNFILANIFFWSIFIMVKSFGQKDAKTLLIVSSAALLFAAASQIFTNLMTFDFSIDYIKSLSIYIISLCSFIGVSLVLFRLIEKQNLSFAKIFASLTLSSILYIVLFYFIISFVWGYSNIIVLLYYLIYTIIVNLSFTFFYKREKLN